MASAAPKPKLTLPPIGVAVGVGVGEAQGTLPLPWLAPAFEAGLRLQQAHALLLVGPAGAGHLELALLLAQAALCEEPEAEGRGDAPASAGQGATLGRLYGMPCGHCPSCHLVRQRGHPDLLLLLPDALRQQLGWAAEDEGRPGKSDAKPSRELRVAQVREAIAWGQQSSSRGRGKLMLLHPADALNAAAANALLKTLEEPPGALRLLLTTADAERLLPTVRSRCQRVPLALPDAVQAQHWLAERGLAADAPALLALAGGSPLEALAWAAEGLDAQTLAQLPRRVAAGDAAALAGRPVPRVLQLLLKLAHDLMALTVGAAPRFYPAESLPPGADLPALLAWQRELLRAARHDEHPWNAGLLVEALVAQASQAWPRGPGPAGGARGQRGAASAAHGMSRGGAG